ncbi:hypothetical protein I317_06208 [Kwoniella heveanensis CBS 569]|nr:hypothetical protein I317_06208 [Kwoniella heveanensis CBS 569]
MSQPTSGGGQAQPQASTSQQQPTSLAQPIPAQPPSRSEIERKLSFRSAASTRAITDSPKKKKPSHPPPPHAGGYHPTSGNESDSSSITSSTLPPTIGSPNPTSPILTPATTSVGGLSAIAERKLGMGMGMGGDMLDEMELEDVEEEAEGEAENEGEAEGESGSEDEEGLQGLERGMEGERVVKSGYLYKKQERRKAWKKRWFVLRTGKLAYYKDEKEYSLKRVLDLHEVHTVAPVTVKKHPHSFGIVTPKRTFFAKGSSQDDMEEWVRAINGVRRRISEREEEERMKREKSEQQQQQQHQQQHHPRSTSIPIPQRDRGSNIGHENVDTASLQSQVGAGSYFVSRPHAGSPQALQAAGAVSPGLAAGGVIPPSSPMDTTNSLTSQMAKMSIPVPRTPSAQSNPGQSVGSFMSSSRHGNTAGPVPTARAVSAPSFAARREPSTSSIGSSAAAAEPYSYSRPSALTLPQGGGNNSAIAVSSEDEDDLEGVEGGQYESFNQQGNIGNAPFTPIDPNKVILSAYLMKRSKGRGRKVWRKRWFVLTSQGVTYTKSHMDTKALRYIPLTSVLDALEVDASDPSSGSESDQPPSAHSHSHSHSHSQSHAHMPSFHPHAHPHGHVQSASPPQKQGFHNAMRGRLSSNDTNPASNTPKKNNAVSGGHGEKHGEENTFRLITAKRTFVLCAPSEEDEIKWLAAVRALLNQSRNQDPSPMVAQSVPTSPTVQSGPSSNATANTSFTVTSRIPTITQQPPTPASLPPGSSSGSVSESPAPNMGGGARSRSTSRLSQSHNSNMSQQSGTGEKDLPFVPSPVPAQIQTQGQSSTPPSASGSASSTPTMNRGRSATYLAKSAVADVVRKFHPERVQGDV